MRICILSAMIAVVLTNNSCAGERTDHNLITTYDPGEMTAESQINPHLSSYEQIAADDRADPREHSHFRFEDQTPNQAIKFENYPKDKREYIYQNDRFINNEKIFKGEIDRKSQNKIQFESTNHDSDRSNVQQTNKYGDNSKSDTWQVVFEDHEKPNDKEGSEHYRILEKDKESAYSIKFEYNEPNHNAKNFDSDRNIVTKRVVFEDNEKQQEPVRKNKKKSKRNPRFQTLIDNPVLMTPNSTYHGLDLREYPAIGYPISGNLRPGDPNFKYSGYQVPGQPDSGYTYPGYPNPYPGVGAYPTATYLGYPGLSPGYGIYPPSAYQGSEESRPPANPVAHPSPGKGGQRFPSQEYPGSPTLGGTQTGKPGGSFQAPEYPYYQGYPAKDPNSQYPAQSPPGHSVALGYQSGQYRPSRRPKSLTQRAVSAVAEALTSIALYDDYQCVPRLLCEVACGSTASSPTLLKATAGLQPLLTVLQSYNGVSTSPLLVFGRAAVLGITAKGNPSNCIRAYPQCPNNPEQLINYLNNHNGGFFRFFGQPDVTPQPKNLEEFYNYLTGQYGNQLDNRNANLYDNGVPNHSPYANNQTDETNYHSEDNSFRNANDIDNEIEARIQNKPGTNVLEDENDLSSLDEQDTGSKWLFPDQVSTEKEKERLKITKQPERPPRESKTLKFPVEESDDRRVIDKPRDHIRKEKHIFFPKENNIQSSLNYEITTPVNPEEYVFDHKQIFYVKKPKAVRNDDVVYVVRGNGDPNHPEIVKVRPGQSL